MDRKIMPAAAALLALLLLIAPTCTSGAETGESVFTIQVSSYQGLERAQSDFGRVISKLPPEKLDYFRVETVGEYYALRLGKFPDRASAEEFLKSVSDDLPGAIIVESSYVQERIRMMYRAQVVPEGEKEAHEPPKEQDLPLSAPEEKKSPEEAAEPVVMPEEQAEPPAAPEKQDVPEAEQAEEEPPRPAPEEPEQEHVLTVPPPGGQEETRETLTALEELPAKLALIEDLVQKKDYPSALQVIGEEISERPGHPGLSAWYGMVLLKTGRAGEALPYLTKAAALSPAEPDYHSASGYCHFYLGEYARAAEAFDRALALEPAHVDALAGLGIVRVRQGDRIRARAIYDRLKSLDSTSAVSLLRLIEGHY